MIERDPFTVFDAVEHTHPLAGLDLGDGGVDASANDVVDGGQVDRHVHDASSARLFSKGAAGTTLLTLQACRRLQVAALVVQHREDDEGQDDRRRPPAQLTSSALLQWQRAQLAAGLSLHRARRGLAVDDPPQRLPRAVVIATARVQAPGDKCCFGAQNAAVVDLLPRRLLRTHVRRGAVSGAFLCCTGNVHSASCSVCTARVRSAWIEVGDTGCDGDGSHDGTLGAGVDATITDGIAGVDVDDVDDDDDVDDVDDVDDEITSGGSGSIPIAATRLVWMATARSASVGNGTAGIVGSVDTGACGGIDCSLRLNGLSCRSVTLPIGKSSVAGGNGTSEPTSTRLKAMSSSTSTVGSGRTVESKRGVPTHHPPKSWGSCAICTSVSLALGGAAIDVARTSTVGVSSAVRKGTTRP